MYDVRMKGYPSITNLHAFMSMSNFYVRLFHLCWKIIMAPVVMKINLLYVQEFFYPYTFGFSSQKGEGGLFKIVSQNLTFWQQQKILGYCVVCFGTTNHFVWVFFGFRVPTVCPEFQSQGRKDCSLL